MTYGNPQRLLVKGLDCLPSFGYNDDMKTTTTNGNTTRTINGKTKGPKPIQTLAQLKENILRDALAKEVKKIDKVLDRAEKQRRIAHAKVRSADETIQRIGLIRAEFLRESGLAPKA